MRIITPSEYVIVMGALFSLCGIVFWAVVPPNTHPYVALSNRSMSFAAMIGGTAVAICGVLMATVSMQGWGIGIQSAYAVAIIGLLGSIIYVRNAMHYQYLAGAAGCWDHSRT